MKLGLLCGGISIFLLLAPCYVESPKMVSATGELTEYTQDFSNLDSVNADFEAYYVYTMGGSSNPDTIYSSKDEKARWYLEGNSLNRQSLDNDIALNFGTNSIGVITFTKQKYTNFELEVDYKSGALTYYWPVIGFRQNEKGQYHLTDGAGDFVQNGGKETLWGTDGVGGPYESGGIQGYVNNTWHHMKLRVEGISLAITVDSDNSTTYKRNLPSSFFRTGYLSLISVNNDCSFKDLSIKELAITPLDTGYSQPADLNSTDSNALVAMAGEEVDSIDELNGIEPSPTPTPTTDGGGFSFGGLPLTISLSVILAIEAGLVAWSLLKKRKE